METDLKAIEKEIIELRKKIEYNSKLYYENDAPVISDYEYDMMYKRLNELESAYPQFAQENSPTKRVGGQASEKFGKVNHEVKMNSLADVFSFDEVSEFVDKNHNELHRYIDYSVEPKIDGLSVSLEYRYGELVIGSTRGDGVTGENVTENLKTIKSIPHKLPDKLPLLEVRGEVYMSRSSFAALNEECEDKGIQTYANCRNAAAGSLRVKDSKVTEHRNLDIFIFNIQRIEGMKFASHTDGLNYLRTQGFSVIDGCEKCNTKEQIINKINNIGESRDSLEYDIDGVVIKADLLTDRSELGENTNTPKWAVAYKFPPERKETKLTSISVQVGRTGVITPIAELEQVRLAGTNVQRATLHNLDFIRERDIKIGDTVYVQKAGEIIPEIIGVNKSKRTGNETEFNMPSHCPSCGEPVTRDEEAAFRCTNPSCPAQLERSIIHFASRDAMNIEGLGVQLVKDLIKNEKISNFADIYRLKLEDVASLERMGEKSGTNLISAIEKSKEAGLDKLIYALGIRNIGEKTAKTLASTYRDIDKLFDLTADEITEIEDFGEITAEFVVNYFSHPQTRELIDELKSFGIKTTYDSVVGDKFKGLTFVLTGTLETMTRSEGEALIESLGGKASSSVSKRTDYVLAGSDAGSKLTKAQALGVKIISEEEFIKMVNG